MSEQPQVPEWIYPGAEVVVHVDNVDRRDDPTIYRATVGKVAKFSFTVEFERSNGTTGEERIYLKDLRSKAQGSGWRNWYYVVLHPSSPKVAKLEATRRRADSRDRARLALVKLTERYDAALMDDLDLLRGAIVALSEHADVVLAQSGSEIPR